MKVLAAVWGVAWVVVGIGAWRAVRALLRATYDDPEPDRAAIRAASSRALRWAYAMVGLGVVMAVVSPWLGA